MTEPRITPWYSGDITPVRSGAYLRDYRQVAPHYGIKLDYFLTDGVVGYWYVNDEPDNQWNDAWWESLPWAGLEGRYDRQRTTRTGREGCGD